MPLLRTAPVASSGAGRLPAAVPAGLLASLVVSQVVYGLRDAPRPPRSTRRILALALAASTAEAARARGRRGLGVTALAGAVGIAAELVGVATDRPFGRYAYTDKLGARVAGVPLLAGAAWAMMARPAWIVAGWAVPSRAARVPVAAAALTAWDVFLDPRMVREGYWGWAAGGRFEDVPASNFAGWFATGLVIFTLVAALDPDAASARDDGAIALYGWTWIGETFATGVLWGRPLPAAAGTAAMGAFAVPALVRRLR